MNLATNTIELASELRGYRERMNDVLCQELAHAVSHKHWDAPKDRTDRPGSGSFSAQDVIQPCV